MKTEEGKKRLEQLISKIGQQKLLGLLFLLGLSLYLLSRLMTPSEQTAAPVEPEPAIRLEESLEELLSKLPGAGRVQVVLTVEQEKLTVFQTDENSSESEHSTSHSSQTVLLSGNGLVKTTYAPIYRGAVVGCEGAERASLVLKIKEAVSSVTGLSMDQITVIPIK